MIKLRSHNINAKQKIAKHIEIPQLLIFQTFRLEIMITSLHNNPVYKQALWLAERSTAFVAPECDERQWVIVHVLPNNLRVWIKDKNTKYIFERWSSCDVYYTIAANDDLLSNWI